MRKRRELGGRSKVERETERETGREIEKERDDCVCWRNGRRGREGDR